MDNKLSKKDIASILYMTYMNKYCEDTFSFDHGDTFSKIKTYYNNLVQRVGNETINEATHKVRVSMNEGTDYDYMHFSYEDEPELVFEVTSLIDYDNKKTDGYTGNAQWADVGLFLNDYTDVEFDDLEK